MKDHPAPKVPHSQFTPIATSYLASFSFKFAKSSTCFFLVPSRLAVRREEGGIMEPPTTPIGRDELALRRHRFFSELLNAAHAAVEHRVRFDPLGPEVAKVPTEEESEGITQQLNVIMLFVC